MSSCAAELEFLARGEVALQGRLRAAQALLSAVEHSAEAVDIADELHEIQVHVHSDLSALVP